jgi:hypothetical protein
MKSDTTKRMLRLLVIAGALAAFRPAVANGLSLRDILYKAFDRIEIQPRTEEPHWAKLESPLLFTFVWMTDFHLRSPHLELVKQALGYVDREVEAHFVMITGDNNAIVPESGLQEPVPTATLRRQRFMKHFLEENLRTPYVIIPGDNWPQDFEKVFGAFQFSFNYGGLHFLFTSLDRCTGIPGQAVFDEPTWQWMREDLQRNKDRPCLFIMHEHIVPPSFLDAGKTRKMLEKYPHVIAVLCGHLHADTQFETGGPKHLICPGLGKNPRCGFKVVNVYREALVLRTVEYNAEKQRYEEVMKWQRVDIPKSLQTGLHKPEDRTFTKHDYSEVPPHARREDPRLLLRVPEMFGVLIRFLRQVMIPSRP